MDGGRVTECSDVVLVTHGSDVEDHFVALDAAQFDAYHDIPAACQRVRQFHNDARQPIQIRNFPDELDR